MSTFTYIGLKAIVSTLRLLQPSPVSPKPDRILQIPSRENNRTIKAHVYLPSASSTPSPVLINLHGSGFVFPLHGSDDVFCRRIAKETNYSVLDIQYRLAPENPFPAALNDVEDVVKYVLSHLEEYDATRISISGFSAGGNLALALLSSCAVPPNIIHSLLAFYPPVDLSIEPGEKVQADPSGPNVIPAMVARLFNACYIGKHDKKDPLVSPAFMDVAKLPNNVLLVSCAYDTLALETERLAERVEHETLGRNLVCKRIEGVSHAWDKSCKVGSEEEKKRDAIYAIAVEMLKE
jgi:acetyl esterase/lipase